jgi:hypothetical protein
MLFEKAVSLRPVLYSMLIAKGGGTRPMIPYQPFKVECSELIVECNNFL